MHAYIHKKCTLLKTKKTSIFPCPVNKGHDCFTFRTLQIHKVNYVTEARRTRILYLFCVMLNEANESALLLYLVKCTIFI